MVYVKSEAGQLAFKQRSAQLSARQRSAFIMIDGIKSLDQVIAATAGLGITQADFDDMIANGFLNEIQPLSPTVAVPVLIPVSTRSAQERYAQAWPLATQLTASIGLRGFRLNLAVESASGYDDLLALLPKIQAAVGVEKCAALENALKG